MPNTLKSHESNIICGLGSYTYTVQANQAPGLFYMSAFVSEVPPSGITITLSQSGSVSKSVSQSVLSITQQELNINQIFQVASGDVLTCAITSSQTNVNQNDLQKNTVKTLVIVRQGL